MIFQQELKPTVNVMSSSSELEISRVPIFHKSFFLGSRHEFLTTEAKKSIWKFSQCAEAKV